MRLSNWNTHKTIFGKTVETLTFLTILITFLIVALSYSSLPPNIPVFFNLPSGSHLGVPKINLWACPLISAIFAFSISKLINTPWFWNMPSTATKEKVEVYNNIAVQMLQAISLACSLGFLILSLMSILAALGSPFENGTYFTSIFSGILIVIPVVFMIILIIKKNRLS